MFQFQTGNRNHELLKTFLEKCNGNIVLFNCYKNKLEFGCTYSNTIEQKILKILKATDSEYPWWVDLLD